MFGLFKKKHEFFTAEENEKMVQAIRAAEQHTSGEVRVYVESHCRFINALDRAVEIFQGLQMHATKDRNAVLVYVAIKDKQLAVFGDEGIHQKVGSAFWNDAVQQMIAHFNRAHYADGIAEVVTKVGEVLSHHFPYDRETDKNELPDDIVFGR